MANEEFVSVYSSDNRANIPVYPLDVFKLTDLGNAQIHGSRTKLPAEALEILVLLDGKRSVGDIEQMAKHLAPEAVRDVLRALLSAGLARQATVAETEGLDFSAFFNASLDDTQPTAGALASASQEAAAGAPQLERAGFYVSIARQAVDAKPLAAGARRQAFVVEDDPDMAALVAKILGDEGFEVTTAAKRADILARLRKAPLPHVVILDVMLPDANGFEILQRLKSHPQLKQLPIIMLTADASPGSVMRGLASGADGYITKPFERANLVDGVKSVLGLSA